MKLALFDDWRPCVVFPEEGVVVDVTSALPWQHDPDPVGNGSWVRLCREFRELRPGLLDVAATGVRLPLSGVRLRPPALNPTKIIACASNYSAHVAEMRDILPEQTAGSGRWLLDFDVFLKAPSSLCGPGDTVLIPLDVTGSDDVHHESELTLVIGTGGRDIPESQAQNHVLGYLPGIDVTVRGQGDRSRRKSYDTFTPIGGWLTTADEIADPHDIDIRLTVGGEIRQSVNTSMMIMKIPQIVAYASRVMRLEPGDLIMTGAPPGVGPIRAGDVMEISMSGLGQMRFPVAAATGATTAGATAQAARGAITLRGSRSGMTLE
jgi:2-keto-4-pentenoate hydratase/2-oxohepta-3-ene-1,7-dioic acid hydratase in catechol pathway